MSRGGSLPFATASPPHPPPLTPRSRPPPPAPFSNSAFLHSFAEASLGAKDLSAVQGSVQVVVLLAILITITRWTTVNVVVEVPAAAAAKPKHN